MTEKTTNTSYAASATSEMKPDKILENFIIFWLDEELEFSVAKNQEHIVELRSIVNAVQTFSEVNQCLRQLTRIKEEKVFLIVSDSLFKQIAPLEDQFIQLTSIYVFCDEAARHHNNIEAFGKGKGTFTHLNDLCSALAKDVRRWEQNLVSGNTIPVSSNIDSTVLPPTFMYCQLLQENLFKLDDDPNAKNNLIEYCKPKYEAIPRERELAEHFRKTYDRSSKSESPIWWYTNECFLFKMLNRALRTLDIEIVMKMSFYIRDLHEQIQQRHAHPREKPPSMVYRGQRLSKADFDKLKTSEGSLQAFNSFLSTSEMKDKALFFARNEPPPNTVGVLWEITIDSSASVVPYTSIEDITAIPGEFEILFSIGAVFRIGKMEDIDDYWRVHLTLTGDRDPMLNRITDHIRRSLGSGTGWRPLAQLMIKMGHFDKAKEIYEKLMTDGRSSDKGDYLFFHNQLGYVEKQMGQLTEALEHYEKAIDYGRDSQDPRLSSTYSNIGAILKKQKKLDQALKYFELALQIDRSTSDPNRLEIAIDYNNIGSVLDDQGKFVEALKNYEKALEIKLAHLPSHHPSLANNYSNIGLVHRKMSDCSTALSYYEKTLAIQSRSLQPNHPAFAVTHGNMAAVLADLGDFDQAIKHAEEAAEIATNAFGKEHPETKRRTELLHELQKRR